MIEFKWTKVKFKTEISIDLKNYSYALVLKININNKDLLLKYKKYLIFLSNDRIRINNCTLLFDDILFFKTQEDMLRFKKFLYNSLCNVLTNGKTPDFRTKLAVLHYF